MCDALSSFNDIETGGNNENEFLKDTEAMEGNSLKLNGFNLMDPQSNMDPA